MKNPILNAAKQKSCHRNQSSGMKSIPFAWSCSTPQAKWRSKTAELRRDCWFMNVPNLKVFDISATYTSQLHLPPGIWFFRTRLAVRVGAIIYEHE